MIIAAIVLVFGLRPHAPPHDVAAPLQTSDFPKPVETAIVKVGGVKALESENKANLMDLTLSARYSNG